MTAILLQVYIVLFQHVATAAVTGGESGGYGV
jgi:hypothetical protein